MALSADDVTTLTKLEESLWIAGTRYNLAFQNTVFADDFLEFGQSGKVYTRDQAISGPATEQTFDAQLPLDNLTFRALTSDVIHLTYNSHVTYDGFTVHARRSSIWTKTNDGWVMRFHQGTPYTPDVT